jgi:hypothetical protein
VLPAVGQRLGGGLTSNLAAVVSDQHPAQPWLGSAMELGEGLVSGAVIVGISSRRASTSRFCTTGLLAPAFSREVCTTRLLTTPEFYEVELARSGYQPEPLIWDCHWERVTTSQLAPSCCQKASHDPPRRYSTSEIVSN